MFFSKKPETISHTLKKTSQYLVSVCQTVSHAEQEARWLFQKLLDCSSLDLCLNGNSLFPEDASPQLEQALHARIIQHQPFSRHFQERFFWKDLFFLNEDTLDPRIETETLIEAVLRSVFDQSKSTPTILDLGTGSGCILISLLKEIPHALGWGIDISSHALAMAQTNASRLGVSERSSWIQGSWFENVTGKFDFIVSNPPYISEMEEDRLSPEVMRWDPRQALFGGKDGLSCYQILAPQFTQHLKPDGHVFLEIGCHQAAAVCDLMAPFFQELRVFQDLFGKDRVVWACRPLS
jgi:release factor glutamine methyltransferase